MRSHAAMQLRRQRGVPDWPLAMIMVLLPRTDEWPCHCPQHMHARPWSPPSIVARPLHLQGLFTHASRSSFEQLWRSGVLPGLVVTLGKCAALMNIPEHLEVLAEILLRLLPELLPAYGGPAQPRLALSNERQQFALLLLARVGGAAATTALLRAQTARRQSATPLAEKLQQAAVRLACDPALTQLLRQAAPALEPQLDALPHLALARWRAGGGNPRADVPLEPLQLLVALCQQLDPLALGLRLRGCYNPTCACLAGDREADMQLKRCSGCNIARWVAPGLCLGHGKCRGMQVPPGATSTESSECWLALTLRHLGFAGTATPPAPRRTGSTTRLAASGWRRLLPAQLLATSSRSRGGGGGGSAWWRRQRGSRTVSCPSLGDGRWKQVAGVVRQCITTITLACGVREKGCVSLLHAPSSGGVGGIARHARVTHSTTEKLPRHRWRALEPLVALTGQPSTAMAC
jgi:hypothetical protein